jgi:ribonucleotide monophosphatase NagD (HAD superfamily)
MPATSRSSSSIHGVLVDLSGTVHIGDTLVEGAAEALQKLRKSTTTSGWCIQICFLTNTLTKPSTSLLQQLERLGIEISREDKRLGNLTISTAAPTEAVLYHGGYIGFQALI